jgi:hypothetical protein
MALPETERFRVEKLLLAYCEKRIPAHVRDQIKLTFRITGNKALLLESRPLYSDPNEWIEMKVSQFEYNPETNRWTLYCFDRNSKRRDYKPNFKEKIFEKLLAEVDADPTGIFWG